MSVVQFPPRDDAPAPLLEGPFDVFHVIVDSRRIPLLTGRPTAGDGINFIVDGRFMGGPFHGEQARQVAWLLAQAIAVASGYSNLEAQEKGRSFAPIIHSLGELPAEDGKI